MAAIIDWPDTLRPEKVDWGLFVPQAWGASVFDGSAQADTLGPARWFFTVTTGPLKADLVPEWEAFLQRLRGRVNLARAWDWRREAPLGVATHLVTGPKVRFDATGASLESFEWTPSTANILKAGSYIGVNGELKRLSTSASSDATGVAVLNFEPPLRALAPAGGVITLVKPTAKFMLMTERLAMPQEGARHPGFTAQFEEDLRA
jgi:hypothetical protein